MPKNVFTDQFEQYALTLVESGMSINTRAPALPMPPAGAAARLGEISFGLFCLVAAGFLLAVSVQCSRRS